MSLRTAPDGALHTLDTGASAPLSQYRGKPLLLFFFNVGCDGCMTRGVPVAAEIARQYPEMTVLGVHSNFGAFNNGPEQVRAYLEEKGVPFPVLMDDGHATFDAYEAEGTPHWVWVDAEGVIQKSIFGSQQNALQRLEYSLMEAFG